MRKVLISVLLTGCVFALFATDARVLTMGREDTYFMDDYSIYRNPANISIYPNMLLGSLGIYVQDEKLDSIQLAGLARYNRDPQKPFFGGILSYSLNQSADAGDQYPMLSLGLVFNRYDEMIQHISPESDKFFGINKPNLISAEYDPPVGKVDVILGYAMKNGIMLGLGTYLAFQKEKRDEEKGKETRIIKGTVGVNWPIAKTMDLEVSVNGGALTKVGEGKELVNSDTSDTYLTIADNDIFVKGNIRLFSALSSFNGDFVPHLGVKLIKFNDGTKSIFGFNGGFAININIDRGFFWAGVEGIYEDNDAKLVDNSYQKYEMIAGKVSFGIERNVFWDWFVWRIGCSKLVGFEKIGGTNGTSKWMENAEGDASDSDLVGFGFGLNIENRLKVDVVMAEDIFYTWTNLISGNHHHIASRISATYSF